MAHEIENSGLPSLAEQQAKMAKEMASLKHMMTQMSLMNEKLINLEQFVVKIYQSLAVGRALPPMPSYLMGLASKVDNGGQTSHATADVPEYSPEFPQYHCVTGNAKSPMVHHPKLPSQSQYVPSPATTQAVHAGIREVGHEIQMKGNMTSVEASCKSRNERQCCSQAPQATPPQHYLSSQNMQYAPPMPQCQVQPQQPFVQMPACQQRQASIQQPRPAPPQTTQNQVLPPSMSYVSRGKSGLHPTGNNRPPRRKKRKQFTDLGETYTSLFHRLHALDLLNPVDSNVHPLAKVDPTKQCSYHSGALGHDTEHCYHLKKAIQSLIDNKRIQLEDLGDATDIDQNPLPTHNGVNMVETVDIKVFMEDSNRSIIYVKAAEASHKPLLSNTIPVMVTRAVQATNQDDNPVLLAKQTDNKMVGLSHIQSNVTSPKRNKGRLKEIDVAKEEHTVLADLRQVFDVNMVQSREGPSNAEI